LQNIPFKLIFHFNAFNFIHLSILFSLEYIQNDKKLKIHIMLGKQHSGTALSKHALGMDLMPSIMK
jgi:hypothetical protein